jgi:hypothetical protein
VQAFFNTSTYDAHKEGQAATTTDINTKKNGRKLALTNMDSTDKPKKEQQVKRVFGLSSFLQPTCAANLGHGACMSPGAIKGLGPQVRTPQESQHIADIMTTIILTAIIPVKRCQRRPVTKSAAPESTVLYQPAAM